MNSEERQGRCDHRALTAREILGTATAWAIGSALGCSIVRFGILGYPLTLDNAVMWIAIPVILTTGIVIARHIGCRLLSDTE